MGVLQLTAKFWTLSGKAAGGAKCSDMGVNERSETSKNGQHNSTEENSISVLKCKDVTLQAYYADAPVISALWRIKCTMESHVSNPSSADFHFPVVP